MILKERNMPLLILQLEALLRRLPPLHPKIPLIKEELGKRMAGYKGEVSLDFPLDFLHNKNYFIFHDLRLPDQTRFFQIDTLVLSNKFVVILEVKNMSGILYFDTVYNQLIRIKNGVERVFPCPILQVNRQASQLKSWLSATGLPGGIPIYSMVVISNPQTGIKVIPPHINLSQKVIHRDTLPNKIQQIEKSIAEKQISEKLLKKFIRLLKKHNTERDASILTRFQIGEAEVLKGIFCPSCNHLPLVRIKRTWHCPSCKKNSRDAHIKAIHDYSLLFGLTITNKDLREFLQLESPDIASRLLKSMSLPQTGANKSRKYFLEMQNF